MTFLPPQKKSSTIYEAPQNPKNPKNHPLFSQLAPSIPIHRISLFRQTRPVLRKPVLVKLMAILLHHLVTPMLEYPVSLTVIFMLQQLLTFFSCSLALLD